MKKPNLLIIRASEIVGGQSKLAQMIGMKKQFMSQIARGDRPLPPKWCRRIEQATGGEITRQELCPDLYDEPDQAA